MTIKLMLIAAACENLGIGKNNNLPWKLRSEMDYFTRMTKTTNTNSKRNLVVMGRKTWDSIPPKYKPLSDRINFILSTKSLNLEAYTDSYSFRNWDSMIDKLKEENFKANYDKIWVIGGSFIYKLAMDSEYFYRLYMTDIKQNFECDTFFPALGDNLKQISDPDVPGELQKENGIEFEYKVFENTNYKY